MNEKKLSTPMKNLLLIVVDICIYLGYIPISVTINQVTLVTLDRTGFHIIGLALPILLGITSVLFNYRHTPSCLLRLLVHLIIVVVQILTTWVMMRNIELLYVLLMVISVGLLIKQKWQEKAKRDKESTV